MRYATQFCTMTPGPGMTIVVTGPYSDDKTRTRTVVIDQAGLRAYRAGAHAQVAFPGLSADDREFLISGTSPEGWDRMFKEDE